MWSLFFWDVNAALIGSWLPTYQNKLSIPHSRVRQSKKNVTNTWVCSYIGNSVGSGWMSGNVTLANIISKAWRTQIERGEEASQVAYGCSSLNFLFCSFVFLFLFRFFSLSTCSLPAPGYGLMFWGSRPSQHSLQTWTSFFSFLFPSPPCSTNPSS
jgi:hypothetical protein